MAHEVVMPQLGLSMESGQIVRWLKDTGDRVQAGETLLEVESDKATVEVEAVESGLLHIVARPEDGSIRVGNVIAYLLSEGESAPEGAKPAAPLAAGPAASPAARAIPHESVGAIRHGEQVLSSPSARRRALELGVDWRLAVPTGPRGQIKERDVVALAAARLQKLSTPPPAQPIRVSPIAQRMAEEAGVDLAMVARQHPGKRLERSDIQGGLRRGPPSAGGKTGTRKAASSLRKLIAERMALSARTNAPVTLTTEADATELVGIREGLKAKPGAEFVPSYNALFVALVGHALCEFPYVNASLEGDEIVLWDRVNIGVAVDTERGLVVPVVHDVQSKSVRTVAAEVNDLLTRAAQGKTLPDELKDGTFTITNLGVYEIDAFTPIINLPECAVLGIGRLVQRMMPVRGQPAVRTMVALSLTFDHRLIDGAPAARFLQRVKQYVEQPYLWLV